MTNVFTKQLSQRLQELGIDIPDTEKYWTKHRKWKSEKRKMVETKPEYQLEQWGSITNGENYPALSLSNLLCLLPVIGEKLKDKEDWKEATCEVCENNPCISEYAECGGTWIKCHARRISHIFLSKSEEQAYKEAEEYILKLIK